MIVKIEELRMGGFYVWIQNKDGRESIGKVFQRLEDVFQFIKQQYYQVT